MNGVFLTEKIWSMQVFRTTPVMTSNFPTEIDLNMGRPISTPGLLIRCPYAELRTFGIKVAFWALFGKRQRTPGYADRFRAMQAPDPT